MRSSRGSFSARSPPETVLPRCLTPLLLALACAAPLVIPLRIHPGRELRGTRLSFIKMETKMQGAAPAADDGPAAAPGGVEVPGSADGAPISGPPLTNLPPLKLGPYTSFVRPKRTARCGLVWMHGLGDTEEGWADILEEEFRVLPKVGPCRFFLPRAPVQKVTCNDDRITSWFDMTMLPLRDTDRPPHYGCSLDQALASCGRVHEAIDKLVAEGVPPERIVVGGFSQGGAMAVLSALTYPKRLAGIIVFSGIVFFADRITELMTEHSKGYEVFWGHGLRDDILDVSLQAAGVNALTEAGLHVTAKQYGAAHSSTPDEMEDAAVFFNGLLAP